MIFTALDDFLTVLRCCHKSLALSDRLFWRFFFKQKRLGRLKLNIKSLYALEPSSQAQGRTQGEDPGPPGT